MCPIVCGSVKWAVMVLQFCSKKWSPKRKPQSKTSVLGKENSVPKIHSATPPASMLPSCNGCHPHVLFPTCLLVEMGISSDLTIQYKNDFWVPIRYVMQSSNGQWIDWDGRLLQIDYWRIHASTQITSTFVAYIFFVLRKQGIWILTLFDSPPTIPSYDLLRTRINRPMERQRYYDQQLMNKSSHFCR
jgi:hypothetical protein